MRPSQYWLIGGAAAVAIGVGFATLDVARERRCHLYKAVGAVTGCADLVVLKGPPSGRFCDPSDGRLVARFVVKNQGFDPASPSTTRVVADPAPGPTGAPRQTWNLATQALAPGESVAFSQQVAGSSGDAKAVNSACNQTSCVVTVTADSAGVVPESNEGNNDASSPDTHDCSH